MGSLPIINFFVFTMSFTGLWATICLLFDDREPVMITAFIMLGMSIGLLFYACVMQEFSLCCSFITSCIFMVAFMELIVLKYPQDKIDYTVYVVGLATLIFNLTTNVVINKMQKDSNCSMNKSAIYPGLNKYIYGVFCLHNCIIDLTMAIFD